MLKLGTDYNRVIMISQPPSGGCVLKLLKRQFQCLNTGSAAFGRLCVETLQNHRRLLSGVVSRLRAAVC